MSPPDDGSDKSRAVALALGGLLGVFGAHRYYVGKVGTGFLQTVTFGGLGLWWMYDMILIAFGSFRDADGRRLKYWTEDEALVKGGGSTGQRLSDDALDELYALREEVAELAERVDFTERLLARGRGNTPLPPRTYDQGPATPR